MKFDCGALLSDTDSQPDSDLSSIQSNCAVVSGRFDGVKAENALRHKYLTEGWFAMDMVDNDKFNGINMMQRNRRIRGNEWIMKRKAEILERKKSK